MNDPFVVGGVTLKSRLFIGTGKYSADSLIPAVAEASGAEVITVALRRVDLGNSKDNVLSHIPGTMRLLPNTSGARTADEAVRIAAEELDLSPEDVEAQLPLYDFSMEITPADAAGLQRTADFMAAQGMMERPIDVRSLFAAPRP